MPPPGRDDLDALAESMERRSQGIEEQVYAAATDARGTAAAMADLKGKVGVALRLYDSGEACLAAVASTWFVCVVRGIHHHILKCIVRGIHHHIFNTQTRATFARSHNPATAIAACPGGDDGNRSVVSAVGWAQVIKHR